jgi:multidrug efflux pump subunit AcrA (membrane-fusion protein)
MRRLLSTLLFLIGLTALGGVLWWFATSERGHEAPQGRPPYVLPVSLADVERGRLEPAVTLTGTVRSSEHARLGFRIGGQVAALEAAEGARVAAGSVLARLADDDRRATLVRAEAALALAQRQLDLAQAGERDEEVARLEAELAQRRAEAELAASEVERNRGLVGTDVITKSRFDALVSGRKAADARVAAAEQALAQARAGTRAEEIDIRRAEVALREAEVAIARTELDKTVLRAPFAASVVSKLASLGETVAAGAAVYDLVDLSRLEVELEVPAPFAARLPEDALVELRLDEAPDFALSSAIDALIVFADTDSRNFRALVRLEPQEDPELVLKPGLFVRARVELVPLVDVLLVPSDAVRVVEQGSVVVRAVEAPPPPQQGEGASDDPPDAAPALTAEWVPVRVLASQAGRSAVEPLAGELAPGDRLVVTGVDLAFPGVPLLPSVGAPAGADAAPATGGEAAQ